MYIYDRTHISYHIWPFMYTTNIEPRQYMLYKKILMRGSDVNDGGRPWGLW